MVIEKSRQKRSVADHCRQEGEMQSISWRTRYARLQEEESRNKRAQPSPAGVEEEKKSKMGPPSSAACMVEIAGCRCSCGKCGINDFTQRRVKEEKGQSITRLTKFTCPIADVFSFLRKQSY